MKRLDVVPRSQQWHAARTEAWTASLAATLVVRENAELLRDYAASKGVSLDIKPLLDVGMESFFGHTLWSVWAEKNGRIPRFTGNEDTLRGQRHEERIIRLFEEKQLILVEREVVALSSSSPGLLASLDARAPASSDPVVVAPHGFPVEAKCPAFPSRKKLFESQKAGKLAILGLPYFWCQVQHQCLVAESPYGWFVAAGAEEDDAGTVKLKFPIIEKVPRDDRFLRAYQAAAVFYQAEFLADYVEPPKLPADHMLLQKLSKEADVAMALASDDHEGAVDLYLASLQAEQDAKDLRERLEAKVLAAAEKVRTVGSNVVLLANRLQVEFGKGVAPTAWQEVAKKLAASAGLPEVPKDIIEACKGKPRESVKLTEVH